MRHAIDSRLRKIDTFFASISKGDVPEELQSVLCQFGTVLVCGLVERSVEIIITERLRTHAHPKVISFIKSNFKRGRNQNCEAISELLGRFDADWRHQFEVLIQSCPRAKLAIDSGYEIRNSVAHGGTHSLGVKRLAEIYAGCKELIEILIQSTE